MGLEQNALSHVAEALAKRRTLEPGVNLKKGVGELNIASSTVQLVERAVGSWSFKDPLNHLLSAWQCAGVWQG